MSLVYRTDFAEGRLPEGWHSFSGEKYDSSQISFGPSTLDLYAGAELMKGCGVNMESDVFGRTYGEWQVCLRLDRGLDTRGVALLWPVRGGGWPPEVDFFEIGGESPERARTGHNVHYKDATGKHRIVHEESVIDGDFSEWHVIGCLWRENYLGFTVDGVLTNTVEGEGEAVPTQPLKLHLQTAIVKRVDPPPAPTPTHMQVDWVRIYD